MTERESFVLAYLRETGPSTVDEFLAEGDRYVNSWAPVFTNLKEKGLIASTGDMRTTRRGAPANVWGLA